VKLMSADAETEQLIARRKRLLGPAYRLFYEEPVHLVRGEGVFLYDSAGRRYLDAYNNVASVGHCHPRVVAAIAKQAAILNTHTRYLHETVLDLDERLLSTFPVELGNVMFTCTGSEANDLALRIARTCTDGTGFIATETAYHGVTSALVDLSPSLGLPLAKDSPVRLVPPPRPADAGGALRPQVPWGSCWHCCCGSRSRPRPGPVVSK
jgi:4-aminobutyrate aminotransferase-like enzyme